MPEQPKEIQDAAKATIAYTRDPKLFSHMSGPEQAKALREFVADAIGRCVAPLIARERVEALRDYAAKLGDPATASFNDLICAAKLAEYTDAEEAKAGEPKP